MRILKHPFLKPFKNLFAIIFIVFAIWMLFFDANSWFIHNELNNDKEALENEKEFYKKGIKNDEKVIKELSSEEGIEKFAREEYYLKKDNEEIFIIEYEDSLKLKENE